MSFSRYAIYWETLCDRHGWSDGDYGPGEHWDELTDNEKNTLETLWWAEGLD